jgi:P27 family predicted phage terminase small subunit
MPTPLRLLTGDQHKNRYNTDEPAPRASGPALPAEIGDEVAEVWHRVVGELTAMGIAYAADADALRCFCEAVVVHRKASFLLARSPVLVKGTLGGMVRNPAIQVQRDAATTIRQFAAEFGLTPSSRSTIHAQETGTSEADNPFTGTGTG